MRPSTDLAHRATVQKHLILRNIALANIIALANCISSAAKSLCLHLWYNVQHLVSASTIFFYGILSLLGLFAENDVYSN